MPCRGLFDDLGYRAIVVGGFVVFSNNSSLHAVEDVDVQVVDAVKPVRKAHMMGRIKITDSEEGQGVTMEEHIKILISKWLTSMKETHARISVANSLVQKCTSSDKK